MTSKTCMKNNSKLNTVSFGLNIPAYSPISIFSRLFINSLVAIFIIQFIIFVIKDSGTIVNLPEGPKIQDYLRIILYFNILSESLLVVDLILEKVLPVPKKIKLRILIQTISGLVLIAIVFNLINAIDDTYEHVTRTSYFVGLALGLTFVTLISTSLLIMRITQKWIQSQKEMDVMKQEKLKMDYNSLQDKLNPHFLFNNLSVLKSLIIYDQDTAIKFTENFTDVYRYVLQSKDKVLISLADELEFIDAYISLHKERLGDGLQVEISIDKRSLNREIAPLTLQLLVENAIKHNITSKTEPLKIEIIAKPDFIGVINTLQLKESSYSTHTGIKNLKQRYKMLSEFEIEIVENDSEFMVKVPLV